MKKKKEIPPNPPRKKKSRKTGRKPKITTELLEKILSNRALGLTIYDSAIDAGISERTYYYYRERAEKVIKKYNKNKSLTNEELLYLQFFQLEKLGAVKFKKRHLGNITARAIKDGQWTASSWMLERMYPDEFAKIEKHKLEHTAKSPLDDFKQLMKSCDTEAYTKFGEQKESKAKEVSKSDGE